MEFLWVFWSMTGAMVADTEKIKSIEQPRRGTFIKLETTGSIQIPVNIYTYIYTRMIGEERYKSMLNRGRHFPSWRDNTQRGFLKDMPHPIVPEISD